MKKLFLAFALVSSMTIEAAVTWKEGEFSLPPATVGKVWIVDLEAFVRISAGSIPRFQASGSPDFLTLDPATSVLWGVPRPEDVGETPFQLLVTDGESGSVAQARLRVNAAEEEERE